MLFIGLLSWSFCRALGVGFHDIPECWVLGRRMIDLHLRLLHILAFGFGVDIEASIVFAIK